MNCPDFGLLSAYHDQEAEADERLLVDEHLPHCADCRQQLDNLRQVGGRLRLPAPALRLNLRPRPKAGWWQKLKQLADSPVVHLVSTQRRRRARFGLVEMCKIMALFALPVFFMSISSDRSSLLAFLAISALGLMIGLPLRQFSEEVALLASLRRGRCLEEIVGTGTSAQGLLDGLALQGLFQIGRAVFTVWPVLLLGTLGVPPYWRQQALRLEIAWLPGLLALFLAGYYLAQLVQVWNGPWPRRLAMLLAVSSPWTLAFFGLPGCLAACLVTAVVARSLAIHELENPVQVRAVPVHRRNRLVRSWSDNPITRRELSRLAGRMGAGWHRLLLWRASMALAPLAWGLYALQQPFSQWIHMLPPAVLLFCALFFVRSALLTLPAVVREREQQSWHILMQTPLAPHTVIRGWLQVCFYTTVSEGIFALLTIGLYGLLAAPAGQRFWPLVSLLLLPLFSLLGAYLGLALSADSRTQREAGQRFILWSLAALLSWLLIWGIAQGLQGNLYHAPVALLGPIAELALLPVAVVLALKARPLLRRLPCIDPSEREQVNAHYSPALVPLDLGSLMALGYVSVCWNALSQAAELSALKGPVFTLVGGLVWLLCLRLPLATLAELQLGRRFSLLLGALFGLWLGWTTYLAIQALSFRFHDWSLVGPEVEFTNLLGGLVVGALAGGIAARNASCSQLRRLQLRPRLWRSGLLGATAILIGTAALDRLAIPDSEIPYASSPHASVYWRQISKANDIYLANRDLYVHDEIEDRTPYQRGDSWEHYAERRSSSSVLARLRSELPPFGEAAPVAGTYESREADDLVNLPNRANLYLQTNLHALSVLFSKGAEPLAALNCDRWALLLTETRPRFQSDGSTTLNDENATAWLLKDMQAHVMKGVIPPGMIEQLLERETARLWLSYSYNQVSLIAYRYGDVELQRLLPDLYTQREKNATDLARGRAQRLAHDFKLWELSHDGGAELLEGLRFIPLTRRRVYQASVDNQVEAMARNWTHREGVALLAGIQLYRRDHGQRWPDNLEQAQRYLPRPARCYLNQAGTFDYQPGSLSCASDNGLERLVIYNHGK